MDDICLLMNRACFDAAAKARAEGREASASDYRIALETAWEGWLNASVSRDMRRAGFVETAAGWESARSWGGS